MSSFRFTFLASGFLCRAVTAFAASTQETARLRAAFQALMTHACFELAESDIRGSRDLRFNEQDATQWWWENGGHEWLASYVDGHATEIVLPPEWPDVLRAEEQGASHPMVRLLCRSEDKACGCETAGWVLRANEAFATTHFYGENAMTPVS